MTALEMYRQFNICYDNVSSNQSPGFDTREVSVYLTRAQNIVLNQCYGQYEKNELSRKQLANLVCTAKLTTSSSTLPNDVVIDYPVKSRLFVLPEDFYLAVMESIVLGEGEDKCFDNMSIAVYPVSHDEFVSVCGNPFRCNDRRALRLDVSNNQGVRYHEIYYKKNHPIKYYFLRYIKKPKPIIIEDIDPSREDLYIESMCNQHDCEMDSSLHMLICETAAKIAASEYKN